jgi:hypothetical protein
VRHSKYERCGLRLQLQQVLEFVSGHLAAGRRVLITDAEGERAAASELWVVGCQAQPRMSAAAAAAVSGNGRPVSTTCTWFWLWR